MPMTITIQIPDSFTFEANGESFTFTIPQNAEFIARAAIAGITKTLIDASSGAAAYAEKNSVAKSVAVRELVEKRIRVMETGEWTARAESDGESALRAAMHTVARPVVKAKHGKAWGAMDTEKRDAEIAAYVAGLSPEGLDTLRRAAQVHLADVAEAAARKAKRAAELAAAIAVKI